MQGNQYFTTCSKSGGINLTHKMETFYKTFLSSFKMQYLAWREMIFLRQSTIDAFCPQRAHGATNTVYYHSKCPLLQDLLIPLKNFIGVHVSVTHSVSKALTLPKVISLLMELLTSSIYQNIIVGSIVIEG